MCPALRLEGYLVGEAGGEAVTAELGAVVVAAVMVGRRVVLAVVAVGGVGVMEMVDGTVVVMATGAAIKEGTAESDVAAIRGAWSSC